MRERERRYEGKVRKTRREMIRGGGQEEEDRDAPRGRSGKGGRRG